MWFSRKIGGKSAEFHGILADFYVIQHIFGFFSLKYLVILKFRIYFAALQTLTSVVTARATVIPLELIRAIFMPGYIAERLPFRET